MKPILLILLVIMVPTVFTAVPEGCVTIKNRHTGRYLVSSYNYDPSRRHLAKGSEPEQWIITREKGDIYRIKHAKLKEELFESALNRNGHFVFTWIPEEKLDERASWRLREVEPTFFELKNVKFNHCLHTSELTTWIGVYRECYNHKYEWQIVSVPCEA